MTNKTQKRSDKDHRKQISKDGVKDARNKVVYWLNRRLEEKGYGTWTSRHEILGIIVEEYHEIIEAVHNKSILEVEAELVDMAVGCIFAIACIEEKGVDW